MAANSEVSNLNDLLDRLQNADDQSGDGQVALDDMLKTIGTRAYAPLLLLPALIAISPLGAIPGMAAVLGLFILLIAGQMLLGRTHPWLPGWLTRLSYDRDRVDQALARLRRPAGWLDRLTERRWPRLTGAGGGRVLALALVVLGLLMFPAAVLPGGNAVVGLAVLVLSLGLVTKDGLIVALGLAVSGGALILALRAMTG